MGSVRSKDKTKLLGFVSPAYTPGRWSTFEFQAGFQFDAVHSLLNFYLKKIRKNLNHTKILKKLHIVARFMDFTNSYII